MCDMPVRCFSCGKVISPKYDVYKALCDKGMEKGDALTTVGLSRYCCRVMVLSHVELVDQQLEYCGRKVGRASND